MAVPGSLDQVRDGILFKLAGQRIVYFKTTTLMNIPLFFLTGTDLKAAATTLYVVLIVLPFFLFTVCRGGKRPLRIFLNRLVRGGFVQPGIHVCRAGGLCSTLIQRSRLRRRIGRVTEGNEGASGTWTRPYQTRTSQNNSPTNGKQQGDPCNTKRRPISRCIPQQPIRTKKQSLLRSRYL